MPNRLWQSEYNTVCRAANLQSFIVSGVNKSAAYEVGGKLDVEQHGAHWNAICVDGDWRLFDVFWASTCVVGRKSAEWALFDAQEDDGAQVG
jgi:transglutaminase/protease-like cytokinesis protein 3